MVWLLHFSGKLEISQLVKLISFGAILFLLIRIPFIFNDVNPKNQTQPADYAENFLTVIPENALVFTSADLDSFPLWYYHFGLKWRGDIRIVVLPLTQFRWYQQTMIRTYPDLIFPEVIATESNNNQNWGAEVERLNTGLPLCKTTILKGESPKIIAICSNGLNLEYPTGLFKKLILYLPEKSGADDTGMCFKVNTAYQALHYPKNNPRFGTQ